MKHILLFAAASFALAACQQQEPEVVGGPQDPMADELANATPVDVANVPMMLASHPYRCSGSNALLHVDWIRTGEELSARVTPSGAAGITLPETAPGQFSDENNSLTGSPTAQSITFNGASCKR